MADDSSASSQSSFSGYGSYGGLPRIFSQVQYVECQGVIKRSNSGRIRPTLCKDNALFTRRVMYHGICYDQPVCYQCLQEGTTTLAYRMTMC